MNQNLGRRHQPGAVRRQRAARGRHLPGAVRQRDVQRERRLTTIYDYQGVLLAAQQAIRAAQSGQNVDFPQAPAVERMTPKIRALANRYARLRRQYNYELRKQKVAAARAAEVTDGMLPRRWRNQPFQEPSPYVTGLGKYYGYTTYQPPRPLTLDPFSSSFPLRGLGLALRGANGVQGCGQATALGVGFDETDPLTKKDKRILRREDKAAAVAWLENAKAELTNTIQGYMDGAIAPNATVSFTPPPFTTTDKGARVKKLARQYEKLRSRDLPRAQTWARAKAEAEGWAEVPSQHVTPPSDPPPPDTSPVYPPPTAPTDTTGITEPDGGYSYDAGGNGFRTDYGPYGGGVVYPDSVTPGAGSGFIQQTLLPTPDAEGVFEEPDTSVARKTGDEIIWVGGIAMGLAGIIGLFYMLKQRKGR